MARLKSALIRVLSKSVRGNFFESYYYFAIRRSLKRDNQGQVLQGAKQPPRRRRAFNAAQMRERRRFFFSLSLSRLLTSLPAAVMFYDTFRPLCEVMPPSREKLLFGDKRGAPRERDFFLCPRRPTGESSIFSKEKNKNREKERPSHGCNVEECERFFLNSSVCSFCLSACVRVRMYAYVYFFFICK